MDTREERARDVRNSKSYSINVYLLSLYWKKNFPFQLLVPEWVILWIALSSPCRTLRSFPPVRPSPPPGTTRSLMECYPALAMEFASPWEMLDRSSTDSKYYLLSFYFWWLCSLAWTALWFGPPYRTIIGTQTRFKVRHFLMVTTHSSDHASGGRLHLRLWLGRLCLFTSNLSHGERSYFTHICIR